MKKLLVALLLFASSSAYAEPQKPLRIDFQSISVAQVVQLLYSEAFKSPYLLSPDVLADSRMVSFRYSGNEGEMRTVLRSFLDSLGYGVESRGGVDFVLKRKPEEKAEIEQEVFVYRPRFRDVSYLSRLLAPLFKGSFTVNRSIPRPVGWDSAKSQQGNFPDDSAAALVDQAGIDALVFSGSEKEVAKLKQLLSQVDFANGEVTVRGVVYEVRTKRRDRRLEYWRISQAAD
jgi:type II secretory pathway component GspD/PulD (secretin)